MKTFVSDVGTTDTPYPTEEYIKQIKKITKHESATTLPGFRNFAELFRSQLDVRSVVHDQNDIPRDAGFLITYLARLHTLNFAHMTMPI